ncbi:MAG: hypothetical protein KatS3mg053_0995 [Candidatus Roseilinea sp.]|nr:MAG: hypothetical protein KatS3mg053_0995 [Candidatus Roseilinea sp.]
MIWVTASLTVAMTGIWAWLATQFERPLKAPWVALGFALAWGALPSTLFSLAAQNALMDWATTQFGEDTALLLYSTLFTGVIEELIKGIGVVLLFIWQRDHFQGWRQGVIYGAVVGLGFALFEHIKFLLETPLEEQIGLFVRRVIIFGLSHAFYTGLIGIGLGLARSAASQALRALAILGGFVAAAVTHIINNASAALAEPTQGLSVLGVCGNYVFLAGLYAVLFIVSRRRQHAPITAKAGLS